MAKSFNGKVGCSDNATWGRASSHRWARKGQRATGQGQFPEEAVSKGLQAVVGEWILHDGTGR